MKMRLNLNTYRTSHEFDIRCCGEIPKKTKGKSGACWFRINFKCQNCGKRGLFTHWHREAYTPSKEEKEAGMVREPEQNSYTFEVNPK